MIEDTFTFQCIDDQLVGILHHSDRPLPELGVLIIVGGPQYRVGSHRQFILLARDLAKNGTPCMRFDFRGMGDSTGNRKRFMEINDDISAAINEFMTRVPSLKKIILWGLCDGASASMIYAYKDHRICSIVVLNPWVRTESGLAESQLKSYYLRNLFSISFWKRLLSGKLNFIESINEFIAKIKIVASKNKKSDVQSENFIDQMLYGLNNFNKNILLILSGNDLTATEFTLLCKSNPEWENSLKRPNVKIMHYPEADHTFSSQDRRNTISQWTQKWIDDFQFNGFSDISS